MRCFYLMNIFTIIKKRKAKQVISLYSSMTLSLFVGIGISVINTRLLGAESYGDYKFILNFLFFILSFITFGFFFSGGRLIAQKENESIKHKLMSNLLIITVYISLLFICVALLLSFLEEMIYENNLGYLIRIFLPLLFVFPFQYSIENILQGDNRIYTLSLFRLGPKTLYLITAISLNLFIPLTLFYALFLNFITLAFFVLLVIYRINPSLKADKSIISIIWSENKTYGFHVYIGAITGVASAYLAGLSLGYFVDNINVGYFALALTATKPLTMIPTTIGTTFFKEFAKSDYIPKKVFLFTGLLALIALIIFLASINKIVEFLYSEEFKIVAPLSYFTSIGAIFHGLGDFFNRFLGAHGKGKELRNSNFQIGIVNILGYTFLIYFLGVYGAALTKLLAGLTYFIVMLYYYSKFRRSFIGQ